MGSTCKFCRTPITWALTENEVPLPLDLGGPHDNGSYVKIGMGRNQYDRLVPIFHNLRQDEYPDHPHDRFRTHQQTCPRYYLHEVEASGVPQPEAPKEPAPANEPEPLPEPAVVSLVPPVDDYVVTQYGHEIRFQRYQDEVNVIVDDGAVFSFGPDEWASILAAMGMVDEDVAYILHTVGITKDQLPPELR